MSGFDTKGLASRLREAVVIEQPVLVSDGLGGNTQSWQSFTATFAEITPMTGSLRETVIAAHREAIAAYNVILRKNDGVNTAMRIVWRGKILFIHSIATTRQAMMIIAYEGGEL